MYIAQVNPFFDAYVESDSIGKCIFLLLIALSVVSWSILLYKAWMIQSVSRNSEKFKKTFYDNAHSFLQLSAPQGEHKECPNAFYLVYEVIQSQTNILLAKNEEHAGKQAVSKKLSSADVDLLASCARSTISSLTQYLEKHVYILSTIVTLAPFLGLLGTVYGILTTFSSMQQAGVAGSNQMVLGGLSLALTTTVIGLIDAIPALVGYNYLKNRIYRFNTNMVHFATEVLSAVELHYRRVD